MIFLSPWWLCGLAGVISVAVVAMFRPARRIVTVSSLQFWREAVGSVAGPANRRLRRISISWLLLLCGAVAAIFALAAPTFRAVAPARKIAAVETPAPVSPVTFDAVAAEPMANGRLDVFVALQNQTDKKWTGLVAIGRRGGDERDFFSIEIKAGGVLSLSRTAAAADYLEIALADGDKKKFNSARLVRRSATVVKVALLGPDEPILRRYIRADPLLVLARDAEDADVLVANRIRPPPGARPALVIDPPTAPPGWRRGGRLRHATLRGADEAADDPLMKNVDLAAVAVRRMNPWLAGDNPPGKVLVRLGLDVLLLRSDPSAGPRRVYIAFDLSARNTNLAVSEQLVILLANIFRWLAPTGRATVKYVYQPPAEAVAAVPPAEPTSMEQDVALWPPLAAAAIIFWLAGWALKLIG